LLRMPSFARGAVPMCEQASGRTGACPRAADGPSLQCHAENIRLQFIVIPRMNMSA
jgi:hypothetical protein